MFEKITLDQNFNIVQGNFLSIISPKRNKKPNNYVIYYDYQFIFTLGIFHQTITIDLQDSVLDSTDPSFLASVVTNFGI